MLGLIAIAYVGVAVMRIVFERVGVALLSAGLACRHVQRWLRAYAKQLRDK